MSVVASSWNSNTIQTTMFLTRTRHHAIASGSVACAFGSLAIMLGDHHDSLPFKTLVALGVALVLGGLFLLRYSWTIRARN